MRLINVDKLMDFISEHSEEIQYAIEHKDEEMLETILKEIPTSYDVEKIIEKLNDNCEKHKNEMQKEENETDNYSSYIIAEEHGCIIGLQEAIKIVKGGETEC